MAAFGGCLITQVLAVLALLVGWPAPVAGQMSAYSYTAGFLHPPLTEPIWLTAEAAVHLAVHHINTRNFSVVGQQVGATLLPELELEVVYYPGLSADAPNAAQRAAEDVYAAHTGEGAVAVFGPYSSREALQAASVASVSQKNAPVAASLSMFILFLSRRTELLAGGCLSSENSWKKKKKNWVTIPRTVS